jgi:hypothetical protein
MGGFLQAFWAPIASVGSRERGLQKGFSKLLSRFIEAVKTLVFVYFHQQTIKKVEAINACKVLLKF